MEISEGNLVIVRRRSWRVVEVHAFERCQIVKLAGIEAANRGQEQQVLTPFDRVHSIQRRSRPRSVSVRKWRRGCRAAIAAETPPGRLLCARAAQMDLLAHQLEPAMAIVNGLGSRVLLADDVGLGKTVQAGLIVAELRARGAAERVLIVTPAGLREQWQQELCDRLALQATIINDKNIRRATRNVPVGVSPWATTPLAIASVDYIKRVDVLAACGACRWDVLVVDEAHGAVGESNRRAAISALAARAPYVVLLTATPHSGDRRSFAALCELGQVASDRMLMFRRHRQDVHAGGVRRVHQLAVRPSVDEERMYARLAALARALHREKRAPSNSGETGWLVALSVLHKRAWSSASSLQRSVARRLASLARAGDMDADQRALPFDDPEGELTAEDEAPLWPETLTLADTGREHRLLEALGRAAATAALHETKIRALGRFLRRVGEPALVFTEYRDTLLHLHASLGVPSLVLHGGLTREERAAAVNRFTRGGANLLLATDAAGEGLNLHYNCRIIVNLELPWSPVRLEQRIGRVDRIGQQRPVHVLHLIAAGSGEETVLARLQTRVAQARADVGGPDPLADDVDPILAGVAVPSRAEGAARPDERISIPSSVWTPVLASDAKAEAERVAFNRRLDRGREEAAVTDMELRGPSIVAIRRWRTRTALRGRVLTVWRVTAQAASGRVVATKLVTVALATPAGRNRFRHLADDWLERRRADILTSIDQAAAAWRADAERVHQAFVQARIARRDDLDVLPRAPSFPTHQPGMFDHRARRAQLALFAADQSARRDQDEQVFLLDRDLAVSFSEPQLLFVVTP